MRMIISNTSKSTREESIIYESVKGSKQKNRNENPAYKGAFNSLIYDFMS